MMTIMRMRSAILTIAYCIYALCWPAPLLFFGSRLHGYRTQSAEETAALTGRWFFKVNPEETPGRIYLFRL